MSDIDLTIKQLFKLFTQRKAELQQQVKKIPSGWKTHGSFPTDFSLVVRPKVTTTSVINIQTATRDEVIACATIMQMYITAHGLACARLEVDPLDQIKFGEYTTDQWYHDLSKRLMVIDTKIKQKQLEELEARLNQVVSPEERRRTEVEILAQQLGDQK